MAKSNIPTRAKGQRQPHTETRLAEICALMRDLKWVRGKTGPILAAKWGISETVVAHLAAEASKRVRAEVMDPDRVQGTVGTALERVLVEALAEDHPLHRKNAIDAAKVWAGLAASPTEAERAVRLRKLEAEAALAELNLRQAQRLAGESGTDPADGYEDPAVDPAPADPEAVGGGPGDP